jgi:chromosome segregation ATPase
VEWSSVNWSALGVAFSMLLSAATALATWSYQREQNRIARRKNDADAALGDKKTSVEASDSFRDDLLNEVKDLRVAVATVQRENGELVKANGLMAGKIEAQQGQIERLKETLAVRAEAEGQLRQQLAGEAELRQARDGRIAVLERQLADEIRTRTHCDEEIEKLQQAKRDLQAQIDQLRAQQEGIA